jgi:serine/threonine protein phosphatase PrpC
VVLSAEHRVGSSNEGERERVLAAGGEITRDRIFSDLQLSRSIGDLNYKHEGVKLVKLDKLEPQSLSHKEIKRIIEPLWAADQVIISKPSFWKQEINTDIDEFVILASDGLFDHVAPQEAVNFVRYYLLNNQHLQIAAQELSDLAIRRASVAADNVGILIVAFKQTERLDKH